MGRIQNALMKVSFFVAFILSLDAHE